MDEAELTHRFAFHAANEVTKPKHEEVRGIIGSLALYLNEMLPEGREKSLVMTHLEDAMMWANASIARNEGGNNG